jgi:hypothetical protein
MARVGLKENPLAVVAKTISSSGGDVKKALAADGVSNKVRGLLDIFHKFRGPSADGATVTEKDVDLAVGKARQHVVEKYSLATNGLSREEVEQLGFTGKRAVELAKALKASAVSPG